jgi:hypothetical protein
VAYFKVHLVERRTWVCARLLMNRKVPSLWVPLPAEDVVTLAPGLSTSVSGTWTGVMLNTDGDVSELGALVRAAYAAVKQSKAAPDSE